MQSFQRIWSVLHVPAIALPGFFGEKELPIGIQMVAPRFMDANLLEAANQASLSFNCTKVFPVLNKKLNHKSMLAQTSLDLSNPLFLRA